MGLELWRPSATTISVALLVATGCGRITFGSDRIGPDAGVLPDAAEPALDAETPDPVDAGPPPDLGCIEVPAPGFPSAWPYQHTKGAYVARFLATSPSTPARCAACHRTGDLPPLVPQTASALDAPGALDKAIGELWATTQPIYRDEVGASVSELLWAHRAEGGAPPVYTDDEHAWLERFLDALRACAWVPVYLRHRDDGPRCEAPPDAGVRQDAAAADARAEDGGGAIDAGGVDAGTPDVGPPDGGVVCECTLAPMELTHCEAWR